MKKIMCIFGTRPEAIKMAPLIKEIQNHSELTPCVCLTAQHRSMLDQAMEFFELKSDYDLDLMAPNQSLVTLAGNAIKGLGEVIEDAHPDAILVQGDTTTTLSGALAGYYAGVPVGHVEAGLRTGNFDAPFPEEMNRVLTTKLAKWHFCPTMSNKANLLAEGVDEKHIFVTGNTVIDALLWTRRKQLSVQETIGDKRPYVLITGHRRESFGTGFEIICKAIASLAQQYPSYDFVYPVHLNPNVQDPVNKILSGIKNVKLIEPQSYPNFVTLMNDAYFILTDSGGVQEEAPSLGKPVLVMRDTSERTEGLDGCVRLVGAKEEAIILEGMKLFDDKAHYKSMAEAVNPYGDGKAAARIVSELAGLLSKDVND